MAAGMFSNDSLSFGLSVPPPLWSGGPSPGQFHEFPKRGNPSSSVQLPVTNTRQPIVMGTSVLGLKFNGGVIIAADTLGSYGSLARFRSISRLMKVNDSTIIGSSGDYADFQNVKDILERMIIREKSHGDGHEVSPRGIYSYLTRFMYRQRTKIEPFWNTWAVGGFKDGETFLGYVDMIGVAYESPIVATGIGKYYALPLMRDACDQAVQEGRELTENDAKDIIKRALKVLLYRDCRTINKYEFAVVTEDGVNIQGPIVLDTNWEVAHYVKGYD